MTRKDDLRGLVMAGEPSRSKTYWLETYGCQMNKAESGYLEYELRRRGWQPAAGPSEAGVVVLNTCSVRKTAEERIWGRLGFYKAQKRRHPFHLVLMGCMSERLKERILAEAPQIDLLVGNFQKHGLADLLEYQAELPVGVEPRQPASPAAGRRSLHLLDQGEYRFAGRHTLSGFHAFVPIMHGCNNFCTYCIVPYLRGAEVSRNPASILEEIRSLQNPERPGKEERAGQGAMPGGSAAYGVEQGSTGPPAPIVREFTLLGQNVNSYRYREADGTVIGFAELLRRVAAQLAPQTWLRFLTSHPKDASEELIELVAAEKALCRHIHLPVQHGSDRVLAAMGRGYTRRQYLRLVERMRKSIPRLSLTTDILIGFPGESEQDYRLTLDLLEEVRFDDAFTYRYNPREGTRAFELDDDVPEALKQERLSAVIALQRRLSRECRQSRLGEVADVLVEGVSKKDERELLARSESDQMVVLPGPRQWIGSFRRVRLEQLRGSTFLGRELSSPRTG